MARSPREQTSASGARRAAAVAAILGLLAGLCLSRVAAEDGVAAPAAPVAGVTAPAPGGALPGAPSTSGKSGRVPRALFDGTTLSFDAGDGTKVRRWPAHNNTRCKHAPGKHAAYPSDPGCECPILPGTYRIGPSEKATRFFGGIWMPISGIRRARPELGTRHCGIHSHPTSWRTPSGGCIQMRKADAFALARLVDGALRRGRSVTIEVRNPRYFALEETPHAARTTHAR